MHKFSCPAPYRHRCGFEKLEDRRLLTAWQNPVNRFDVNDSGTVTVLDALIVINALAASRVEPITEAPPDSSPYRHTDVNGDDRLTPLDSLAVLNVLRRNVGPLSLAFSAAPDADPDANGVVFGNSIELRGQTSPLAHLTITLSPLDVEQQSIAERQQSVDVIAEEDGTFFWQPDIGLGTNRVTAKVIDELRREMSNEHDLIGGDIVADWNATMLNVVRDWTGTSDDPYVGRIVPSQPPLVARNLALVQLAMFDVLNQYDNSYAPYLSFEAPPTGSSALAAAASAAHEIAKSLYPGAKESAVFDTTLAESLAQVTDGIAKTQGIEYGKKYALALLQQRANDGVPGVGTYEPDATPGKWNRTAPYQLPPLLPGWGNIRPLAAEDITAFRPAPPPSLTSSEYAQAVDEVMRLGALDSTARTADQTEIARFWADGAGTATPPGHWNRIAMQVSLATGQSTIDRARTMALVNLAMADAGVAAWNTKYAYDLWRPIDAIARADEDANDATTADPNWLPLLPTPPFPTYTSGHSTFSGAAAAVLSSLLGENVAFTSGSDGHTSLIQPSAENVIQRHFNSFEAAADEAGGQPNIRWHPLFV